MSVNEEAVRAWVRNLRSGEFSQTESLLRDDTGYCCLGVACETFRRVTGGGVWEDLGHFFFFVTPQGAREEQTLPDAVQDWLGVDSCDPMVPRTDDDQMALTELNDCYGWDFSRIAAAIESTFLPTADAP